MQAQSTNAGAKRPMRIAFVVPVFPLLSETFIIDQVALLLDRGIEVDVYFFNRGEEAFVSQKYFDYAMAERTRDIGYPLNKVARFLGALPRALRLAITHPRVLFRALNVRRYGRDALALKLLYGAGPLAGQKYDLVHCHFGYVARDFVWIREAAGLEAPIVTSFYGVDVSRIFAERPSDYYDRLKEACSLYFVMSNDMAKRVVEHGFDPAKVRVQPVGIEVDQYPFHERIVNNEEPLRLVAVGRFVEKKGFDDLLRAMAIVRTRSPRTINCGLIGGGPLEDDLHRLHSALGLDDAVAFEGYKRVEEVIEQLTHAHVLIQPSKTAANGDME